MRLDITTAATVRPEILHETYSSFKRYLFKQQPCRVFLNIDPVGDLDRFTVGDVEAVARYHFGEVIVRKPERPGFPAALIWMWNQVESDYFFNLEDDWGITAPLHFNRMLRAMDRHPTLALLRLAKRDSTETEAQFYSSTKPAGVWNGDYYDVRGLHYSGMPSLIRRTFIQGFVHRMAPKLNHERLARALARGNDKWYKSWKFGGYTEPNIHRHLVENIGVPWRYAHHTIKAWTPGSSNWSWECDD